MGSGSCKKIKYIITGYITFDYTFSLYEPVEFRKELIQLCNKYGVELEQEKTNQFKN